MPLPVTFANLPEGDQPLTLLDQQFAAVAGFTVIPCFATGRNVVALQPFLDAPVVNAYTDLSPLFTFAAAETCTGNVTLNVSQLGEAPAYKQNGGAPVEAGDIIQGLVYRCAWLTALNGGAGGFVIDAGAGGTPVPPIPPTPPDGANMITMQHFTSSGTYLPPTGLIAVIVEGIGGGGGGGGARADGTNGYGGGGGGSGGYFKVLVPGTTIAGSSVAVTIGAGGAAETAGGTTSFGSFGVGAGGLPGARNDALGAATVGQPGGGGTATIAVTLNGLALQGQPGQWGTSIFPAATGQQKIVFGGQGGAVFSLGGVETAVGGVGDTAPGAAGLYGGGGSGAVAFAGQPTGTTIAGGAGGTGWVLVTTYS